MADLAKAQKTAQRVELVLQGHAEELAAELSRPPGARDVAAANIALMKMNGVRPQLRRAFREYEKALAAKDGSFQPKTVRADQQIDRFFRGVRYRLNQWRHFEALVEKQLMVEGGELYPEPPEDSVYFERMKAALLEMSHALHRLANPNRQSEAAEKEGFFADIPLPTAEFIEHLHGAYRLCLALGHPRPLRFLDVGCGGGTKVHLASTYFDIADGLEYDAGYAAAARETLETIEASRSKVIQGDGLTFEDYDAYDVIYFYRPIIDNALLNRLEDRIAQTARPRTVLIAPYDFFHHRAEEAGATHIEGRLFVTGISETEAEALRRTAETVGTDVVPPGMLAEPRVGFWRPVVEASLANGWRPPILRFKPTSRWF